MSKTNKKTIAIIRFPNISKIKGIQHAVFTRHGGCSDGDFASLNMSFGLGDEENNVHRNRQIVSEYLKVKRLAFVKQVHRKDVVVIDEAPRAGENPAIFQAGIGDAMVTNVPDIGLAIQVADCQAVMMVDPVKAVIANVHVGWRGVVQDIIAHTISVMRHTFACDPRDLRVGIGPSLGPCCAEFINYRFEIPETYWHYKDHRNRFDLWSISEHQLKAEGVLEEHLYISKKCTKCLTDTFFSYRANMVTGRFASVIALT